MKRLLYAFFLARVVSFAAALSLVVLVSSHAWAGSADAHAQFTVVKVDPRLRSAFVLRTMGSPNEYRYSDAVGLKSQLQTHFDAVLEILAANRERSLALAMARLEQRQGVRWTAAQRNFWQRYLSEQRDQNIERLTAYRDRGQFPLNEGQHTAAAPIFVDNHDTACAVGHLMRESGWEHEVELIAATNLLVYVTDVRSGPLVNWVLQSGLTLGEAALIQPAYAPPISQVGFDVLSGTGAGINAPATFFNGTEEQTIANGLRYENFVFRRFNNIEVTGAIEFPPGSGNFIGDPSIGGDWQLDTAADVGVRTDYGIVSGRYDGCDVCFPEYYAAWPYANLLTMAPGEDRYSISSGLAAVAVSFDVVANHPSLAIDRVGAFIINGFSYGPVEAWTYVTVPPTTVDVSTFPYDATDEIETQVSNPGDVLGALHVAPYWENPSGPYEDSVIFSPMQRVTVHSFILTREDINSNFGVFGAISHEIRLAAIPEPSCVALACCFAIGIVWRRS